MKVANTINTVPIPSQTRLRVLKKLEIHILKSQHGIHYLLLFHFINNSFKSIDCEFT